MNLPNLFTKFYLDKEKDIVVKLFKSEEPDELIYVLETPNHHTGNLITNLARICNTKTVNVLNKYNSIFASLNGKYGTINLDSNKLSNLVFIPYEE